MPDSQEKQAGDEAEVWTAISAFEQILEVIPDDHASIAALADAYEHVGDHTRARDYLLRLGRLLIDEADPGSAPDVAEKLAPYADSDPEVGEVLAQLQALGASAGPADAVSTEPAVAEEAEEAQETAPPVPMRKFNVSDEMAFAWHLLQENQLSQEEYATVVQDLTEMSTGDALTTVSVLHVLSDRGAVNLEAIAAFAARDTSTPIIPLSSFEVPADAALALPPEFMIRNGVFVFEILGQDALVALLNPYNRQLRKDIESALNKRCHFYVTLPADFDPAVNKARTLHEEAKGKD